MIPPLEALRQPQNSLLLDGEGFGREQFGLEFTAERLSRTVRVGVMN
jgi:hypothetical protein